MPLEGVGDLVSLRSEVLVRGVEDEVRLLLRVGWLGGGGEGGLEEVFGGSMDKGCVMNVGAVDDDATDVSMMGFDVGVDDES